MPISPPPLPHDLTALAQLMADLRNPDHGCPWDLEQDFTTIAPYTIEEAYEVADAIARDDLAALKDELGDLLLQTVYHAQLASELGAFTLDDVVAGIVAKMVRRHPHVYGDASERDTAGQKVAWEELKSQERLASGSSGTLAGVPVALPALTRAEKIQKRAARVGFDWPDVTGARAKIDEELAECDAAPSLDERADEIGDLLFSVVNYARHCGVDAEAALRAATLKFESRFNIMESKGTKALRDMTAAELDQLWTAAKISSAQPASG
jgi:nucleoside triphosphate diphosphatase